MAYPRTTKYVIEALAEFDGRQVTMSQLKKKTGLTEAQILGSMGKLIRDKRANITVNEQGVAWTYRSTPVAQSAVVAVKDHANSETTVQQQLQIGEYFELVGFSPSGNLLLKHESGTIYRVRIDDDF